MAKRHLFLKYSCSNVRSIFARVSTSWTIFARSERTAASVVECMPHYRLIRFCSNIHNGFNPVSARANDSKGSSQLFVDLSNLIKLKRSFEISPVNNCYRQHLLGPRSGRAIWSSKRAFMEITPLIHPTPISRPNAHMVSRACVRLKHECGVGFHY